MAYLVEILPHVRQELFYTVSIMGADAISNHGSDSVDDIIRSP